MSKGIDYSRFDHIDTDSEDDEISNQRMQGQVSHHEEEEETNDGWIKIGHVKIINAEREDYSMNYPGMVFEENPHNFTPDRSTFHDEIVTK